MARHRVNRGLTLSRARHRAPGPVQSVIERGLHSLIVSAAAVVLVMAMLGSDPTMDSRA